MPNECRLVNVKRRMDGEDAVTAGGGHKRKRRRPHSKRKKRGVTQGVEVESLAGSVQAVSSSSDEEAPRTPRDIGHIDDGEPQLVAGATREEPARKKARKDGAKVYPLGNYEHYYGYRTGAAADPRLSLMDAHWFEGKRVLDIGCNVGAVSIGVAEKFSPSHVRGVDIDARLVAKARRNLQLRASSVHPAQGTRFPISFALCHGPLVPASREGHFPANVEFVAGNFIEGARETAAYDAVLCLSVTKWIHLNWGDDGIRELFSRVFEALRPGGVFVLEAQPWRSYKRRKGLNDTTRANHAAVQLRPDAFKTHLTEVVGFEYAGTRDPVAPTKGFDRPLEIYRRPADATGEPA